MRFRISHHGALIAAAAVLTGLAACADGSAQGSKPVREEELFADWKGPPATLNDMMLEADAVVVGRFVTQRSADGDLPGKSGGRIRTVHVLRVQEVLKSSPEDGALTEVLVRMEGGERDRGEYIERVFIRTFPSFKTGDIYVLFLMHTAIPGVWSPAFGPDSAYRLGAGRVTAVGKTPIASAQAGRAGEDFLRVLRNYGIGK